MTNYKPSYKCSCNSIGYLSSTSRGWKSPDSHHTVTSMSSEYIRRKETKPAEKTPLKSFIVTSLFFCTEGKRIRCVDSSDIKMLVADQHCLFLRAVFSRSKNKREGYKINKPFSGLLVCRLIMFQAEILPSEFYIYKTNLINTPQGGLFGVDHLKLKYSR